MVSKGAPAPEVMRVPFPAWFFPLFIPLIMVARRRRIVRKFEEAGADRPERARTPEELGVNGSRHVPSLARSGVLVPADDGRYYLSADGLARWNQRRNTRVLIATSVSAVLVLAILLFASTR